MREIELKFEINNFKKIIPQIKKLGGKLDWEGEEEVYYFDTPKKRLKNEGKTLRLKKINNKATLTVKLDVGNDKHYKIKEEFEIKVNDFYEAKLIIKKLGFIESFKYKKYRQHWKIADAAIELDIVKHKYFVEIEGSKKEINEIAHALNLDWKKSTTKSYLDIVKKIY